jgi:CheY-like chemotaxis protein
MKIAICDDEARDREQIKHYINTHSTKHEIIEFNSAIPLLKSIYAHEHFDVLFLDIQMPDSDGWEIAEKLKKTKKASFKSSLIKNDAERAILRALSPVEAINPMKRYKQRSPNSGHPFPF